MAGVALALILGAGGYTYKLYHKPAMLPVNSNPAGATIYINGVEQTGCGRTPCRVPLGPGVHEIVLVQKPEDAEGRPRDIPPFTPATRTVRVAWGQANLADITEVITMQPAYRMVRFDSQTPGLLVTIRSDETGEVVKTVLTNSRVRIDRGRYRYYVEGETGEAAELGHTLEINGNVLPIEIEVGGD